MMNIFGMGKKKKFRKKSLAEIKDISRILIIDDRRPHLVDDLNREGWRVSYLDDLYSYQATELKDSHVICLDILGVGLKLRCKNGLELVKGIKGEYPEKKILLYSSVSSHNIFDESIDLVDKRILKDGQPYQFIHAVEELSYQVFDWNHCVREIYEKYRGEFGTEISLQEFDDILRKSISNEGTIDIEKLSKYIVAGINISTAIGKLIKTVLVN
jgi:hypothetical protein